MNRGYEQRLYLLELDHRDAGVARAPAAEQPTAGPGPALNGAALQLAYEGLLQALSEGLQGEQTGVVVDGEFGSPILEDAHQRGLVTAFVNQRSGEDASDLRPGADFARQLQASAPTFAKALARHNPLGDRALNQRQSVRLAQLSEQCHRHGPRLLLELRVPATEEQLAGVGGDLEAYDLQTRPLLMQRAVRELQRAGVEPDVWILEGLARREDCERLVATVRHNGRAAVGCLLRAQGADEAAARRGLDRVARVEGYIGFAAGEPLIQEALTGWHAHTLTRTEAVMRIARHLREWVDIFERERPSSAADAPEILTHGRAR
jgi:myo-inositol catabolism protein IolC